jgi:predicted DCC family thiol-disulfide oxidoreductase YuxK
MNTDQPGSQLVYDGECPFCSRYVALLRLRESVGPIELVDARSDAAIVRWLFERGYDLDEGIAFVDRGKVWFGSDCLNRLALMATPSNLFNRINAAVFRSPRLSAALYPLLKGCRNLVLRLLGRDRIGASSMLLPEDPS